MPKPLVDRLEGIAPSVAIEQRNPTVSSRSTVGHRHRGVRLPPAALGPRRPELLPGVRRVRSGGTRRRAAADDVLAAAPGARLQVCFPLPPVARLTHDAVVENLRALGFVRVLADGTAHHLDELPARARPHPGARSCWWWWTG